MNSSDTLSAVNVSFSPQACGVQLPATLKRYAAWDMLSDCGEMAERTKAPVSKTGIRVTVSWVRIPLSPPLAWLKEVALVRMKGIAD